MKVHLIKRTTVEEYMHWNARSRVSLEDWMQKLKYADWEKPTDIKATFRSADLLGKNSNRVVFDIGGNAYRVICKYAFGDKAVHLFICWIGTHSEYDHLNNRNEQFTVNLF